jgi:hypothetical protein
MTPLKMQVVLGFEQPPTDSNLQSAARLNFFESMGEAMEWVVVGSPPYPYVVIATIEMLYYVVASNLDPEEVRDAAVNGGDDPSKLPTVLAGPFDSKAAADAAKQQVDHSKWAHVAVSPMDSHAASAAQWRGRLQ